MTDGIAIVAVDDLAVRLRSDSSLGSILGEALDGRPDMWRSVGSAGATCESVVVAEVDGFTVEVAVGQLQPGEMPIPSRDRPNPFYDGIEQLEALTAGNWFVSIFGMDRFRRRLGVGARLWREVEQMAGSCGAHSVSLIVPLPDTPDVGPDLPVKGYAVRQNHRADTVPFPERRGYVCRASLKGFHSLGVPVTNQLMTKELADG